jgi:peptide/nickel transport system ATP-binding protein/oligopeptide transport system ATP-binding protein
MVLQPSLLVADEPVSSLDASVRGEILQLLLGLSRERGMTILVVTHDLGLAWNIADRVAVMYLGRIVEIGDVDHVFDAPAHPYTQALLSAIPIPDPERERARRRILLTGDVPSPANPPSGCRFRTRCPKFANQLTDDQREKCINEDPPLIDRGNGHDTACHYAEALALL